MADHPINLNSVVAIDSDCLLLADSSIRAADTINLSGNLTAVGMTNLEQYFGPWAIHRQTFDMMLQTLRGANVDAHIKAQQQEAGVAEPLNIRDRIARIGVVGTMTKRGSSFSANGSTIRVRQLIRAAVRSEDVDGILLLVESPGGTVAGTKELADEVAAANAEKPVHVFVEDIGASAAYYVASQASRITANSPAFIGSIGTYMTVYDASQAAADQGIKVHVISTGPFKGAGVPGSQVTDEQLANWQELINESNDLFLDAVARGRSLSRAAVNELADGRVHIASNAKDLGLIDAVGTFGQAMAALRAEIGENEGVISMSDTPKTEQATPQEIRTACPGASADFVLAQFEKGATLQQAQTAFIAEQQKQVEESRQQAEEARKQADEARQASLNVPGNDPHQSDDDDNDDWHGTNARDVWQQKLRAKVSAGINPQDAAIQVDAENPGLRVAMLEAFQPTPKKVLS